VARNLGCRSCGFCNESEVALVEAPRPITLDDVGEHHMTNYAGMIVANAECETCGGKFLAWVDMRPVTGKQRQYGHCDRLFFGAGEAYFDLSFRSTFNDEAGEADMPTRETSLRRANEQIATLRADLNTARSERDEAVRALTAIRDWSVKTREEYRSGYVQMTVTPHGAMPYALHAERTFNGPIAVLLHVTAECNRVLKGAGAAVADGEGR
jgi:hypothetical protein